MFISWQCYEELQITVSQFKEICKFLLEHGVPYILSERFWQDNVENCFGRQRRCDSPYNTIKQFKIFVIMITPLN